MNRENRMKNYIIMAENFEIEENSFDAIANYKKAIKFTLNKEEEIMILFRIALLLDENKLFDEAIEYYNKILNIDKEKSGAYYGKAIAYEELNKYDCAIENYNIAIKYNPNYNRAYYYLATLYDRLFETNKAIENYKNAIKVDNTDYISYNDLAGLYEELEDYELGYYYVNKSIDINPNYYRSFYNKGVIEGRMGKGDMGLSCYEKSIKLNPYYGNNFLNISAIFLSEFKYLETIDVLSDGIRYNAEDTNLYYNRACAYALLNRDKEAILDMNKAIELCPSQEEYARRDEDLKRFFED